MNFGELKTRVDWFIDSPSLTAMASTLINDVRQELATGVFLDERGKTIKAYWPWLYTDSYTTTVAGTSDYALPSDYLDHIEIRIGNKKLHRFTQVDYDSQMMYDHDWVESIGEPAQFLLVGHMIRLKPPPDGAYEMHLHYYASPSAFTLDIDSDYMSQIYPYLIIHKTVLMLATQQDDKDKIRIHGPQSDTELRKALRNELGKRRQGAATVMRTYRDFEGNSFHNRFKVLR